MALNIRPTITLTPAPAPAATGGLKALGGTKLPTIRRAPKVFGGDELMPEPLRILMFGQQGTGKTYAILALLRAGFKVFLISTDAGGLGLRSFMSVLRREAPDLLKNLKVVELHEASDVQTFIYNPAKIYEAIYDFDPDWLVWDGFTTFQQVMLTDAIYGEGENLPIDQRNSETKEYGLLKNNTINAVSRFCKMANPRTGKIWHKILMGHEDVRNPKNDMQSVSTPNTDGVPTYQPWIQGAAKQLVTTAVDISIRTGFDKSKKVDIGQGYRYYLDGPKNKMPKKRGEIMRQLGDEIPGDIMSIVRPIFDEEGITIGMVDPSNVRPEEAEVPAPVETAAE